MLLFVMSYHTEKERTRFQSILDHWDDLVEMERPFQFLFIDSLGSPLRTSLPHHSIPYLDPAGLSRGELISAEWAYVARYISEQVDCDCWFWWEGDVLPVRKDCFEFFMKLWNPERLIMGYHIKDNRWQMRNMINGVAFYAKDFWSFLKPHFNPAITFDRQRAFTKKKDGERFVELNRWYALCQHEGTLLLTPSLRLVHGIKDDSLLRQIVEGVETYPLQYDATRAVWCSLKVAAALLLRRNHQPET